jgi:hypothetical protein
MAHVKLTHMVAHLGIGVVKLEKLLALVTQQWVQVDLFLSSSKSP